MRPWKKASAGNRRVKKCIDNINMAEVYSHEIDETVKKIVDAEFKAKEENKPKNKDYLQVDPPIPKQSHFCVSFCPPKTTVLQEAETLSFCYFIAETVKRKELVDLLTSRPELDAVEDQVSKLKDAVVELRGPDLDIAEGRFVKAQKTVTDYEKRLAILDPKKDQKEINKVMQSLSVAKNVANEESENYEKMKETLDLEKLDKARQELKEAQENHKEKAAEKKRFLEEMFNTFMERYSEYKNNNKVLLRNRMKDYFGKEVRVDYAFKVRGAFKNEKKAKQHAKEVSDVDKVFPVFIGEMGTWMPFNPSKYMTENYESANDKMNELIRGHREEQEKAAAAHGLRKELLMRQGAKIAEDVKRKNQKAIEAGEFGTKDKPNDPWDGELQESAKNEVPLTQIDDWKENPEKPDPNMIEVDLLTPVKGATSKTKIEEIENAHSSPSEKTNDVITVD